MSIQLANSTKSSLYHKEELLDYDFPQLSICIFFIISIYILFIHSLHTYRPRFKTEKSEMAAN